MTNGMIYSTTPVIVVAPTVAIGADEAKQYGIDVNTATHVKVITRLADVDTVLAGLGYETPWCIVGHRFDPALYNYMIDHYGSPDNAAEVFDVRNNNTAWHPKKMRP